MPVTAHPLPTAVVRALQAGEPDAHGQAPERALSDGAGVPCRHCLRDVPAARAFLILAHRPFARLHRYAEAGPIFLCAEPCAAWGGEGLPPILATSPDYLLKGYDEAERIVYGTGRVTPAGDVEGYAAELLSRPGIAFVDVRSARNNCFLCRLTPA
jgi:hypothetical protein